MPDEPVHRGILALDIEKFGWLERNDRIRGRLREALYDALRTGFRHAAIGDDEQRLSDHGDSVLALLDPHVSKQRLLDPLLPQLAAEVAAYNAACGPTERMRLRVVVHAGEVVRDDNGFFGEDLNHAFRLLEAPALRERLAAEDGPVAVIVSNAIYGTVVKHGYSGIPASAFSPVRVSVKETVDARAWIWVPHAGPPAPAAPTARTVSNLLPPTQRFTGRDTYLDSIGQLLRHGDGDGRRHPVVALHGLPGVGKTQLARAYAYRHAGDYDVMWWIRAERPTNVLAALAELAQQLGFPAQVKRTELADLLVAELARRGRWLLVFDNAEDQDAIAHHVPAGGGHVLITTRNPAFGRVAVPLRVDVFAREEATRFLLDRTTRPDQTRNHQEAAAARLAEATGDLPLALEQAAAYVEQTGLDLDHYLGLFERHQADLLNWWPKAESPERSVAAVLRLALERVAEQEPAAVQLAGLCACLGGVTVPDELVRSMPGLLPPPLGDVVRSEPAYLQVRSALIRHSLAESRDHGFSMHRLVQAIIRQGLPPEELAAWAERAVTLLAAAWPDNPASPEVWPECRRLLPHTIAATELAESLGVARDATARLLRSAGVYHGQQAEPSTASAELDLAQAELRRALAIFEALRGTDDPEVAETLLQLSRVLLHLDRLDEATAVLERAARIYEAADPRHPRLGTALTRLGETLLSRGRHRQAERVLRRALVIHETAFGRHSGRVAWTLAHLGHVHRRLGNHAEARAVLEQSLHITEDVRGRHDYRVAETLTMLGRVLRRLGDYDAAQAALERALTVSETAFGPEHYRTAEVHIHAGALLRDQGDLTEARASLERALATIGKANGPDSSSTARARTHLGRVLRRMEKLTAAREAFDQALRDTERARGPDHPQVAWTLVHLSTVLQAQGHLDDARAALQRALGIVEGQHGGDHPDVAWILTHLSAVTILQQDAGGRAEAKAMLDRARGITQDTYGPNHLDVAWTLTHVGSAFQQAGELREARDLLERALAITETTSAGYGGAPRQMVWNLTALGLTLRGLGESHRAREVLERAYRITSMRFGPDHPETRAAWQAYSGPIPASGPPGA